MDYVKLDNTIIDAEGIKVKMWKQIIHGSQMARGENPYSISLNYQIWCKSKSQLLMDNLDSPHRDSHSSIALFSIFSEFVIYQSILKNLKFWYS